MFTLNKDEVEILKSQIATSSWGGRRNAPNVFTEHGVLMLSSVLNSEQAIQVNIQIMRIFSKIRQFITENTEIRLEIAEIGYNGDIDPSAGHTDPSSELVSQSN